HRHRTGDSPGHAASTAALVQARVGVVAGRRGGGGGGHHRRGAGHPRSSGGHRGRHPLVPATHAIGLALAPTVHSACSTRVSSAAILTFLRKSTRSVL